MTQTPTTITPRIHPPSTPLRLLLAILLLCGTVGSPSLFADPASPLEVTVQDTPDPVAAGAQLLYTITIVNSGGASVDDVALTNQLNGIGGIGVPPQLQITSSRGSCTQSTTLVNCYAGTMEGRGSWTVTIRGIVTAAEGTVINNTVGVSGRKSTQNFNTTVTTTTMVSGGSGSPMPDLSISKNGPSEVQVSSPMTYTLTVYNTGTAPATNVKVVDTVPAGLTAITASGTSLFDCSVAGQTVTCVGGAVNQGANASISINATAPAAASTITNTAAVDPDNSIAEGNELNNTSALVNTNVVPGAAVDALTIDVTDDPGILAGAGPDPVIPGAILTYKIRVTNPGSRFADDVQIVNGTQGLVASSVFVNQVVTNGTIGNTGGCWVNASQVECRVRRLEAGGSILMTVSGSVIAAAGSTILNTSTVTGNIKQVAVQTTDTELTTVKPDVDLTITKADSPDPVCASSWPGNPGVCGGGLTYTFVVGNSGINPANNVTIRDPLPAGTHFDSFVAPAFAGGCSVDGSNVLTCTGGTIPPESTTTVTIVLVAPPGPGTIMNVVTVDPNNAIFEADETNNTAVATTLVVSGVDLVVSKTDAIDPIATSGTQTWTITVDNIGTQNATNIRVRDTLPANTIFRDVVADNGFTCSHSNGVVECFGGSLLGTAAEFYPPFGAPGDDTATIVIRAFAQPFEGTMHNEVRVDPLNEIPEANEANNFAFQDTVVTSGGAGQGAFNQFTISKSQVSPANPVARNAKVTYTVTVGNDGTDPAVGITVRDFLPAGSQYIEATGTNMFNCSQVNNYIDCVGGQIAAGGSATLTITMFAPDTPGTYTNQAIVDPDGAIPEGNEFDNQASVQTVVENGGNGAFNDLAILKTATPNTTPGGPIQYDLQVWNNGSDPALDVDVRDVLPAGVTFVSASDLGVGAGAAFTCSHSAGVVNCTGATIQGGGVANARSIRIQATAPDMVVPSGILNTATVDPDNTVAEGDEFNNTSSDSTTVTSKINLTVTKTGPTTASQSQVTNYKITVFNKIEGGGQDPAYGVVMVDPLPVGLIPLAVDAGSGNNWACEISQNPINLVHCIGDLPTEEPVEISITVFITAENGRPLDNVACVDPDNTIVEQNEFDNCSEFGTLIGDQPKRSPNLLVSKQVDSLSTTPGAALTYTITVANVGTARAQEWNGMDGLTVTDDLPSEVTFINTTTTNGWLCSEAAGVVTCHDDGTSGLDVGANAQITILTSVNTDAAIPIANTATAVSAIVDDPTCVLPNECENETAAHIDDNSSTVISSIGSSGFDLAIASVTDVPDPVAPGHPLQYTVVAVNGGTDDANGVHVQIDLPTAGVTFLGAGASNGFNCADPVGTMVDCVGNLPGGGNTTITIDLVTLLAGMPTNVSLTATIDPTDAFPETNEGNNSQTEPTSISGAGCSVCIDLVAAQLVASPEPVASGGSVTLEFLIVNVGDTPTMLGVGQPLLWLDSFSNGTVGAATPTSSNPAVTCQQDGSGPNSLLTSCGGNLAPGEGATITLVLPSVTGTELSITGTADPTGLVMEADEANNALTETVVIN